ncbi:MULTISPECIES: 4Fe-4S dicluster domain-containing protein [Streptomyces]|uniref:4Fe-4S dicluster domain-containing protein n=1 Tax=Streptomyces TaxID=1883 RepID=UPI00163CF1DC|nr:MULTISPECIES: 4Fe-4S binding protein [Streptomyces]MBC2875417.1 4Fe-4S binding protein [Streptomyces sp. TYQ1024]UBI35659.1 4Fe-4S binding protein [Streptomyces mobaraensis]UKW28252.1 4Fe-4S binding protein [Streptomyces sp. TYQ1024]
MTYVITEPCIDVKDGACVDVCPVDCIEGAEAEAPQFYIDPARCVDCDLCATVCPVDAIFREEELPEEWGHFTAVNADYFTERAEA